MKNKFFQRVGNYFKNIPARFKNFFGNSGRETYASMCLMGTGQMLNGQYVKGLLYLLAEVAFVAYFALRGVGDIIGFSPSAPKKPTPGWALRGTTR